MKLESINRNKNGDWYIVYSYPSIQKITKQVRSESKNGKRELIIVGIPKARFKNMFPKLLNEVDEI